MSGYLLQGNGDRIVLGDSSGFLLLGSGGSAVVSNARQRAAAVRLIRKQRQRSRQKPRQTRR